MSQVVWLRVGEPVQGWWLWRAPAVDARGVTRWWGPRARSATGAEALCGYEIRRRAFSA